MAKTMVELTERQIRQLANDAIKCAATVKLFAPGGPNQDNAAAHRAADRILNKLTDLKRK